MNAARGRPKWAAPCHMMSTAYVAVDTPAMTVTITSTSPDATKHRQRAERDRQMTACATTHHAPDAIAHCLGHT